MNRLTLIGLAGLLAIGTGVKLAQGKGKQAVDSPSLQSVEMQVQKASPIAQQPPTDLKPQPIAAAPKLPSITTYPVSLLERESSQDGDRLS